MTYAEGGLSELLPALYRGPGGDPGGALEALLSILGRQADVLDADIAALYDNWFVETCAPWVVPYIGDLLRTRALSIGGRLSAGPLEPGPRARLSERGYVANTIAYRRRKGTVAVLERLAYDVTGWRAKAVEFFQLLSTTQHVNHVRPLNVRTPDLRDTAALDSLDGPFDRAAHTAELRPVDLAAVREDDDRDASSGAPDPSTRTALDGGRYAIPNVGLFVWRLQDYRVSMANARSANPPAAGYTFDPVGLDVPLFNSPRSEPSFSPDTGSTVAGLATEQDVPAPLRRRPLFDELEAVRQAIADGGQPPPGTYFTDPADREPILRVWHREAPDPAPFTEVPREQILICDLTDWRRAPTTVDYTPAAGGGPIPLAIGVAVDPALGRLTFPSAVTPAEVRVSFSYGAVGDLGGGPYDRRGGASTWFDPSAVTFQRGVTKDPATLAAASDPSLLTTSLRDAVADWLTYAASAEPPAFGVIAVMDSSTYTEDLIGSSVLEVPEGCRLAIVAADWPDRVDPTAPGSVPRRAAGELAADAPIRPHVDGAISVRGTAPAASAAPGELILDGLLVGGVVTVLNGNLGTLRVVDCTLVPAAGGLAVNASANPQNRSQLNGRLSVVIDRSICGPIALAHTVPALHVGASVVDAAVAAEAVAAPGTAADLQRCTVFGSITVQTLDAGNSVFASDPGPPGSPDTVAAARLQQGCVRFCRVSDVAPTTVPRRFRCQPDLALLGVSDPDAIARIRRELTPAFTSTVYGQPGYAQLADACAPGLTTGAEDGSEMGATSSLLQPQREANLRTALDEYLRFGLEAGIFHVT